MLLFLLVKTASDSRNNISLDSLLNSYYFRFYLAFCLISCRHSHQHARKCLVLSITLSHSKRSLTPTKWNKKSVKKQQYENDTWEISSEWIQGIEFGHYYYYCIRNNMCTTRKKKSARKRENYNTAFFTNISFFFLHPWSHMAFPTTMPPYYFWFSYFFFFFIRLSFAEGSSLLH